MISLQSTTSIELYELLSLPHELMDPSPCQGDDSSNTTASREAVLVHDDDLIEFLSQDVYSVDPDTSNSDSLTDSLTESSNPSPSFLEPNLPTARRASNDVATPRYTSSSSTQQSKSVSFSIAFRD
jgi:hypothetical protein